MIKIKHLVLGTITILLILAMSSIVSATSDYATIIRGNDNQWLQFPSTITKSWITNWDGYYTYNGTINKISTSENVTFQIQYLCIERTEVDKIQEKSDATPEDGEFNQWLNSWAVNLIEEERWSAFTDMKIDMECKLGENVEHEHLVFVKVLENESESIVWQGYGDGFTRISESRKKVNLESIEITTPPTKVNYTIGELFDNTGMVITAKYSDGSSKVVTNYTYAPQEKLKITDTAITIVYSENNISKEVSQEITVIEKVGKETNDDKKDDSSKEVNQQIKDTEKKDNTTAKGELPKTGEKMEIILVLIAVSVIGVVIYSKYRRVKDV